MPPSSAMTDLAFHILLALSEEPLHGYALILRLRELEGRDSLRTGTVYAALSRLQDEGWVEEAPRPAPGDEDERRRYYRVTEHGLVAARAEARRLAEVVERARAKALLEPAPRG